MDTQHPAEEAIFVKQATNDRKKVIQTCYYTIAGSKKDGKGKVRNKSTRVSWLLGQQD